MKVDMGGHSNLDNVNEEGQLRGDLLGSLFYLPSFLEHAVSTPSKDLGAGCLFLTPAPTPTGIMTVGMSHDSSVPRFPVCLL